MIISQEHDLSEMAKPLHDLSEEQVRMMAKEAGEILGTEIPVRVSERGTHIYVDYKKDGREITVTPAEVGEAITNGRELADALVKEWESRERSRAYVRGEVDGSEFEGKYQPPETEGIEGVEEHEEDRAC